MSPTTFGWYLTNHAISTGYLQISFAFVFLSEIVKAKPVSKLALSRTKCLKPDIYRSRNPSTVVTASTGLKQQRKKFIFIIHQKKLVATIKIGVHKN